MNRRYSGKAAQGVEGNHQEQANRAAAHTGTEAQHTNGRQDQHERQELFGVLPSA